MAAGDLVDLTYVRTALELDTDETDRDGLISQLITPASEAIIDEFRREFAPATDAATRRVRVDPRRTTENGAVLVSLSPYDLRDATTVVLGPDGDSPSTLVAGDDYVLEPEPARDGVYMTIRLRRGLAYDTDTLSSWGFDYLDITGDWGFETVPDLVQRMCALTIQAWMQKQVSVLALAPKEQGDVTAPPPKGYGLPPEVLKLGFRFYRSRMF